MSAPNADDRDGDNGETPLEDGIEHYLQYIQETEESGNYRTNAESVLTRWQQFCHQRGVESIEQLSDDVLRKWGQYQSRRVRKRRADPDDQAGIAASSARAYFRILRAFLNWADDRYYDDVGEVIEDLDELVPSSSGTTGRTDDSWTDDDRRQLYEYVCQQARDAIEDDGRRGREELRNWAFVALLVYSSVDLGQLLRVPQDARRNGVTWREIDGNDRTLRVIGSNGDPEDVQLS